MLPEDIRDAFNADDSTMMFIIFDTTTSADETMDAIEDIRALAGKQCFLSGMSAIVTDTKNLAESEVAIYVLIAVVLSCIVLALTMESYLIPVFFLLSIGMAIIYNMGSNIFMGQISYITKALSAVLQLGVTMDYSIFLWHSYQEQREKGEEDHKEAMAKAIAATIKSVVGSSITTIAGFIALCFMSFTLGLDLGIVMTKGVVFGVICCVTVLPSMIMIFDNALEKTKHRQLIPDFPKISDFVVKHHVIFAVLFVVLFVPFAYFQAHASVYYNLDASLPDNLPSVQANTKLSEEYDMGAAHMILLDKDLDAKQKYNMIADIEKVDGVKQVLGLESIIGPAFPESMIPDDVKEILESDNYELMLIMNSLPVILVMVIEGAIFINMGIPFLTGTKLPFIASIVIGTIQLGATVDYAILITSRYEKERGGGKSKKEAIQIAHKTSIRPVMVSAFSFFAATFGVGMYSQIDMISSLCLLMARGALISMCAVLLFLPAMFWLFDGIICKTSLNFRRKH